MFTIKIEKLFHSKNENIIMRITLYIFFVILISDKSFSQQKMDSVRLNDIRILASHNSYKKKPHPKALKFLTKFQDKLGDENNPNFIDYGHLPIGDQFSDYGIRGVELDVNYDPKGKHYRRRRVNLFLFGQKQRVKNKSMKEPGFKLLHISDVDFETNYLTLIDALKAIKDWSVQHEKHIPIFINIEAKGSHPADQSKALRFLGFKKCIPFDTLAYRKLEAEISSVFSKEDIFEPSDFKGDYSSIQNRVEQIGWPYLNECLGKVFFILEGNNQHIYRKFENPLMFYYGEPNDENTAFLLRNNSEGIEDELYKLSNSFMIRTRSDAGTVQSRNNDYSKWESALKSNAQIISTDYYQADQRWSNYKVGFKQIPSLRE